MSHLDDPETLAKLVALPGQLMAESRKPRWGSTRRIQFVQTALALEILLCAPLRLANLVGIELNKHLPRNVTPGREVHLRFTAEEMKNRRPMTLPLSDSATRLLDLYLRTYRPLIAGAGETALFIGPDGKGKKADTLREAIIRAVRRHVGIEMTPTSFAISLGT